MSPKTLADQFSVVRVGRSPQGCVGCVWHDRRGTCYKPAEDGDQESKDNGDHEDTSAKKKVLQTALVSGLGMIDQF